LRVALTGGIATGKSYALNRFARMGIPTLDADRLAHDAVEPGRPALEAVLGKFGRDLLKPNGHLDRAALGRKVFGDRDARRDLEQIVHPVVYAGISEWFSNLETDKAFALLSSLNQAQRKQAILDFQMRDLVLGPGRDGQTIQPEGIKGAALTEKQRQMLLDLASEWTGILHAAVAAAKMDEMKKNIAETWFAWSGPTEKGSAAYFRIQGPTVIIEYAPQRLGGDATKHIHTIYRDPTNDYGIKWRKP
jgi:hypothetical protein